MKQMNWASFGGLVLIIVGLVVIMTEYAALGSVVLGIGFCSFLYGVLSYKRGVY